MHHKVHPFFSRGAGRVDFNVLAEASGGCDFVIFSGFKQLPRVRSDDYAQRTPCSSIALTHNPTLTAVAQQLLVAVRRLIKFSWRDKVEV